MSDIMTPIPFKNLMKWMMDEKKKGTVFGLQRAYQADKKKNYRIFGRNLETPIGPAAGPHTQLAQNIVAAYYAGSRFFELKTVQKLDGEDLPVNKPCIKADDECYNCEWSTELYVPQAFDEYVKAWFACKFMAKEWGLGSVDGFQFNMSVGYDLDGIKTEKVDRFIEGMKNASETPIFNECKNWLLEHVNEFEHMTREDIEAINADICNSATLSTLHGCPPAEIERIATYLIEEKNLNTFIKCNPTLLGYEYARKTLDDMGYDYIAFTDFHFKDDLQYEDAVPMLKRLQERADQRNLAFGVKITNTFPVDVKAGELPSEEMYMSGKSLFPLSMAVAAKLTADFDGKLRISYSGGCDYHNIKSVIDAGIWPVTMATTMLKPGGYQRLTQMAELIMSQDVREFTGVSVEKSAHLAEAAKTDKYLVKPVKPLPSRKSDKKVPLVDCFIAPCMEACPIHQDITTYGKLVGEGKYDEAFRVIIDKNPLPFITGTICPHGCQSKCTRNFYEESVQIRRNKLIAAKNGFDAVIGEVKPGESCGKKVVVVGAGPAGLSAAYFLAKGGAEVVVYDQDQKAGGVVANIIPGFRIPAEDIEKDVALTKAMGVTFKMGEKVSDVKALMQKENAVAAVLCIGAHKAMPLRLEEGDSINALEFLRAFKETDGKVDLGENVVVIGGGNTAMDVARAAKRNQGVKKVSLVYRRTKRYMPADEEELLEAIEEGVEFRELLAPVSLKDGKLSCRKMELGEYDATGRRSVVETDEIVTVDADTVIASIGEKIEVDFYKENGIDVDERGHIRANEETGETNVAGIYVAGDGFRGASVVVKAIADAKHAAEAIIGRTLSTDRDSVTTDEACYAKKGNLVDAEEQGADRGRCLTCDHICENCVEVCPNRANISIHVPGRKMHQVIHVDYMCNECGNCESFCPYTSAPYKDKFTLFATEADMENSKNDGFVFVDEAGACKVRLAGQVSDYQVGDTASKLYEGLRGIIDTVYRDYHYLILK